VNEKTLVCLSLVLATVISLLLFDTKVSLSGDDCDYIVAAGGFWNHFIYPGHHGSLYPIVLSPFVGLFGVKLIGLKFLSTLFMIASLWLFYKSFQRLVPAIILIPALLLTCLNPYVLFFASYTYSEPLFMLTQALFFYLFSRYFRQSDRGEKDGHSLKKDWKNYLWLALAILAMGLTRTLGFAAVGVAMLYLVIERRWKDLICVTAAFLIVFGTFQLVKSTVWPNAAPVQSFETLLAKNTYTPEQGAEDLSGLGRRFMDNSHIYLSGFLYKYLGFRSSADQPLKDLPLLSFFTYALFFVCLFAVFRKNKPVRFCGLYTGILLFATFILLNEIWAQDRMIMVYYPYILLFLLGGLYYIFQKASLRRFASLYLLITAITLIGTALHAKSKLSRHLPILQQNLAGNDLYGLTPDWENFIKMCRWANDHFDKDAVIVSRKPSMSYVYTGRPFHGIYNVPYQNINEVVRQYAEEKDRFRFVVAELQNTHLIDLAPFIESVFLSKGESVFQLNGTKCRTAIVYKINHSQRSEEELAALFETNQINYTFDYETFLDQYVKDDRVRYQIISPDVLLKAVRDQHIKYLLLPRIRVYTPQNTGRFINTIHQYIFFIQLKYPDMFRIIHTIGKEEICEMAEFLGH
jgi:4-amino-4-deoxy-L-arabinose transferase-like glycosyltransferase